MLLPPLPASTQDTSLDPLEINLHGLQTGPEGHSELPDHTAKLFRHSGWQSTRTAVRKALHDLYADCPRLDRFDQCGTHAWVYYSAKPTPAYCVQANLCNDRWCLPCAQARARTIARNLLSLVQQHQARFITLTLRSTGEPLRDLLDTLYASFSKLRRTRLWSSTQTAAAAFVEVKYHADPRHWNVHLHILATGKFVQQHRLSAEWHRITGTSYIVDIRLVRSSKEAASYITKYASKPIGTAVAKHPDALTEAIHALNHRRLCLTVGAWRGQRLTRTPDDRTWFPVAPLYEIIAKAHQHDPEAQYILRVLRGEQTPEPRLQLPVHDPPSPVHPAPTSLFTQLDWTDWLTQIPRW